MSAPLSPAFTEFEFRSIGKPPSLLQRMADPGSLPLDDADIDMRLPVSPSSEESPLLETSHVKTAGARPSLLESLTGTGSNMNKEVPITNDLVSEGHPHAADHKPNGQTQSDIFKIPPLIFTSSSNETSAPPVVSQNSASINLSSFCRLSPDQVIPSAPPVTTTPSSNQLEPSLPAQDLQLKNARAGSHSSRPSSSPAPSVGVSTGSSLSLSITSNSFTVASTPGDLYRRIAELADERRELQDAQFARQRVLDEHREFRRRHIESRQAAERTADQMDKLVAAVLDTFDKAERMEERLTKRWAQDDAELLKALKAKEDEDRREQEMQAKMQAEAQADAKRAEAEAAAKKAEAQRQREEKARQETAADRARREAEAREAAAVKAKVEAEKALAEAEQSARSAAAKDRADKARFEAEKAEAERVQQEEEKVRADAEARRKAEAAKQASEEAKAKAQADAKARADAVAAAEVKAFSRMLEDEKRAAERSAAVNRVTAAPVSQCSADVSKQVEVKHPVGIPSNTVPHGVRNVRNAPQDSGTPLLAKFTPAATPPAHPKATSRRTNHPLPQTPQQFVLGSNSIATIPSPLVTPPVSSQSLYVSSRAPVAPLPKKQNGAANAAKVQHGVDAQREEEKLKARLLHKKNNTVTSSAAAPTPAAAGLTRSFSVGSNTSPFVVSQPNANNSASKQASPPQSLLVTGAAPSRIVRSVFPPTPSGPAKTSGPSASLALSQAVSKEPVRENTTKKEEFAPRPPPSARIRAQEKPAALPVKVEPVESRAPFSIQVSSKVPPPQETQKPSQSQKIVVAPPPPVLSRPSTSGPTAHPPPAQQPAVANKTQPVPTAFNARNGDRSGRPTTKAGENDQAKSPTERVSNDHYALVKGARSQDSRPTSKHSSINTNVSAATQVEFTRSDQWGVDHDEDSAWLTTPRDAVEHTQDLARTPTPERRYHYSPSPDRNRRRRQAPISDSVVPERHTPPPPPSSRKRSREDSNIHPPTRRARLNDSSAAVPDTRNRYERRADIYPESERRYYPRRTPTPPPPSRRSPLFIPSYTPDWIPPDMRARAPPPVPSVTDDRSLESYPRIRVADNYRPDESRDRVIAGTKRPTINRDRYDTQNREDLKSGQFSSGRPPPSPRSPPVAPRHPGADLLARMQDPPSDGVAPQFPSSDHSSPQRPSNSRGRGRGAGSSARAGRGGGRGGGRGRGGGGGGGGGRGLASRLETSLEQRIQ